MFLDFCFYVYKDTTVIMICFTIYSIDNQIRSILIMLHHYQYHETVFLAINSCIPGTWNIHLTFFLSFAITTHKHESTRADPLSWLSLSERSCSSPILPGPWLPRHTKESSVELSKEKKCNQLVIDVVSWHRV